MKVCLNHSNKDSQLGVVDILEELGGNNSVARPGFDFMTANKAA